MKHSKDIIATIKTEYGQISVTDAVVTGFVQNLIQEIPGIQKFNF